MNAQVVDVVFLEVLQKIAFDFPTQDRVQAAWRYMLGSDSFVMLRTGSCKSLR